jgi:flagellar hook protein FlgE
MIRSMYAAISGLRNHQTMMDVVGNNIANVNTNGFKTSNTVFTDVLSQTLAGGNAPAALGGTNPAQVGLGARLGAINTDFGQGALQRSGRSTDFAIQGDGFFVVDQGGDQLFTRAGSFSLDADGNLVTSEGGRIQGWGADANGVINTNAGVGPVIVPTGALDNPRPTTTVTVTGNLPAGADVGARVSTSITVYNAAGVGRPLNVSFVKLADNSWSVRDGADNEVGTLGFVDGQLVPPAAPIVVEGMTLGLGEGANLVTQFGTGASILARDQDGSAPGALLSFTMNRDGVLVGTYSNGQTRPIAQLAMATFANPQGLEKIGSSQFRVGANSGVPEIGTAGTGGRGILTQGTLEQSNVDLAQEFTNLIVAQRGFQANSRVITTSDDMLQEVVNLKR